MASLVIKFADLASEPVGSGRAVDAEVLVSYTREVPLTDGTVLQAVPMRKQLGPGGTAIFEVTPSDDPTVQADFRGFGLRVEWLLTHRAGRGRQTEKRRARTVKVLTADGATVQFGRLLPAEDVGPQYATVGELLGDVTAVYATVDNLTATATALPPGATPTVTVSGPVPNKVINIGVPRGEPGMGYEEGQQLLADSQTVKTQAQSAATSAQASVTLAQQAQAAALEVPDANMAAILANPATLTAAPEPVNVARFGIAADGATDDTAAVTAAVNAAKSGRTVLTNRALVLPEGPAVYINDVLDLRYLTDVRIERQIKVGPDGLVLVGHSSNQRPGQRIYLKDVRWAGAGQVNVTVRAIGMKQADVTILRASHVELLADTSADATNDGSLAYNTIHLGRLDNLTLRGVGAMGWITQNLFIGGDVKHALVTGEYGPNENTWLKTCVEGGSITFEAGTRNRFTEARCESGTVVTFAARAVRNYVEDSYVGNIQTRQPGATVLDEGVENVYVGVPDLYYRSDDVATLDAATLLTQSWSEVGDAVTPGLDRLVPRAWGWAVDTGVFPVRETQATPLGEYESSWRISRFQFVSDAVTWRPTVTIYDAEMQPLTEPGTMSTGAGWRVSPGFDFWSLPADVQSAQVLITSPHARYARIRLRCGSAPTPFRFARVTAFTVTPSTPTAVDRIRRNMRPIPYQSAKPTQGVWPLGSIVQGPGSTSWKVTSRGETTLTASASSGADLLAVESVSGMDAGDVVGVLLDNGVTHWTTLTSASGSSIRLSTAVPSAASTGRRVATVRWT